MPILAEDMKFHAPPNNDPRWAETNYWGFHIPEENASEELQLLCFYRAPEFCSLRHIFLAEEDRGRGVVQGLP